MPRLPRHTPARLAGWLLAGLAAGIILFALQGGPRAAAPALQVDDRPLPAPSAGPVSYRAAVRAAAPAVVNINTAKLVAVAPHPFYNDPFFRQFFGDIIQAPDLPRRRIKNSLGSGVIVSPDGYLLTNHHVIRGADEINVFLQDGRRARARVIGTDPETDIAVLRIALDDLPVITLADSDRIQVGDVVLAIGNPFGVGQTVTYGIVSATGRDQLGINTFENFIQTDAAINPGNSGGALVDALGRLVGINTAIFSQSGGSQGIGFAIPVNMARAVMEQIITHGRPLRGWLGFEGQPLTPRLAAALGLPPDRRGMVVTGLVRGGPAHRAGLRPGDVVVAIDGKPVREARAALAIIAGHRPGDRVRLEVLRDGQRLTLEATAIERPPSRAARRLQ